MDEKRFLNLLTLIFINTFGIKTSKNTERHGNFVSFFKVSKLEGAIKKIRNREPISTPQDYLNAINAFFETDKGECVTRTKTLFSELHRQNYLDTDRKEDLISKCSRQTLPYYNTMLIELWSKYYDSYLKYISSAPGANSSDASTDSQAVKSEIYSIEEEVMEALCAKYREFHLPANAEYYLNRTSEIVLQLALQNPLLMKLDPEYSFFFKKVLENDSFERLSREEKVVFFNALYSVSDYLDRSHHEDSNRINLELLTFYHQLHDGKYDRIPLSDVRKIQGCFYAIAINEAAPPIPNELLPSNVSNRIQKTLTGRESERELKYTQCFAVLNYLLEHDSLKKLHQTIVDNYAYISRFERRITRKNAFSDVETESLSVLSLIYSNISAIHLQYAKFDISSGQGVAEHQRASAEHLHYSHYLRNMLVRIYKPARGEEPSAEYYTALSRLADFFNAESTRYYYQQDYASTIVIRSMLYTYYLSCGAKEKASLQLSLSPINQYEKAGCTENYYLDAQQFLVKKYKQDFKFLNASKLPSLEEYKKILEDYKIYKSLKERFE